MKESTKISTEKLREEIATLKTQRRLALATAAGALLAFLIVNAQAIRQLLSRETMIIFSIQDSALLQSGKLRLTQVDRWDQGDNPFSLYPLKEFSEWTRIEPGSYEVLILLYDRPYFTTNILVKEKERRKVSVPENGFSTILISIFNRTPRPAPKSQLDLEVTSTGNGYLWVYDFGEPSKFRLIYPDPSMASPANAIVSGIPYGIPDLQGNSIDAGGGAVKRERLLFVVTSSDSRSTADEIARGLAGSTAPLKAGPSSYRTSFGTTFLTYELDEGLARSESQIPR